MTQFHTDFLSLCCANVNAEKQWWIQTFACKQTNVPEDWDCQLPADVALKLLGSSEPAILLNDRAEVQQAGYSPSNDRPILFCANVKKAHEYLSVRGANPGPIQDGGGTQFLEVRDPEGNAIEICQDV